jgi:hypothetical protein
VTAEGDATLAIPPSGKNVAKLLETCIPHMKHVPLPAREYLPQQSMLPFEPPPVPLVHCNSGCMFAEMMRS